MTAGKVEWEIVINLTMIYAADILEDRLWPICAGLKRSTR